MGNLPAQERPVQRGRIVRRSAVGAADGAVEPVDDVDEVVAEGAEPDPVITGEEALIYAPSSMSE